jgi:hypothetical protein
MPQIRPYEQQVDISPYDQIPYHVRATADDFGGASSGLTALGTGLQNVANTLYDGQQTQEISDVRTKLAQARADWTVKLQQRINQTDPGDPNFASTFKEDFNNYLSTIGDGITTKGGQIAFNQGAADLAAHFTQAAGLYQAASVGAKVRTDYLTALNANRNTLLNDPLQFQGILQSQEQALSDPNGPYKNMPAEDRAKLVDQTKEQLSLSAVEGLIRAAPDAAKAQLAAGKWDDYLDADKKFVLEREATTAINAQRIEQQRLQAQAQKAKEQQQDVLQDGYLRRLYSSDPNQALTATEVVNGNVLDWRQKNQWLAMIQRAEKPDPLSQVSHDTTMQLFDAIRAPDGDPRKITAIQPIDDSFIGGNLTRGDHDWLVKAFKDQTTDDGMKLGKQEADFLASVKPLLDKSNPLAGKLDPLGTQQMYSFMQMVRRKEDEYRQAGKNPYDLFDPSKPDYLGKPEALQPFQRTLQDSVSYVRQSLRTGTTPAARPSLDEIFKGLPAARQPGVSEPPPAPLVPLRNAPAGFTGEIGQ